MKKRMPILLAALVLALTVTGLALAASGPAIGWQVIAGGGAPASGGSVTLNDTLGQPISGDSSGGNVALGAGYWSGLGYDETKCGLAEGSTYAYNQTWPVSVTLHTQGNIDCLRVRRTDQNHVSRTGASTSGGVGWGRYWTISATDGAGDPATGFTFALTFPHDGLSAPRACKSPGNLGGSGWDCDDGTHTTFTANTVTRSGITSLSDWAVGSVVGPTAVTTHDLSATSAPIEREGPIGLILAVAGLIASVSLIIWRKRSSRA